MERDMISLLEEVNTSVIQLRGVYAAWSKKHGISYHEMLVLYSIRDTGFCTQKQLCDSYLLPRQTMNHVIQMMRNSGLLQVSPENCNGREKAFILTETGRAYAQPLLASLNQVEQQAISRMGPEKLRNMTQLICEYVQILNADMENNF